MTTFREYLKEAKEDNIKTKDVHISTIKVGDTVVINGDMKTVGKKDLKKDKFLGTTLWGDSFKAGKTPVKKVVQLGLRKL